MRANAFGLTRAPWSTPADHGAAVVRLILSYPGPLIDWMTELEAMRNRVEGLRRALAVACPANRLPEC